MLGLSLHLALAGNVADLATRVALIGPVGGAVAGDVSLLVAAVAHGVFGVTTAAAALVVAPLWAVAADVAGVAA